MVRKCLSKASKKEVAVKFVNKKMQKKEQVAHEADILRHVQHPQLVVLIDTYESPTAYMLVLELWVNPFKKQIHFHWQPIAQLHNYGAPHRDAIPGALNRESSRWGLFYVLMNKIDKNHKNHAFCNNLKANRKKKLLAFCQSNQDDAHFQNYLHNDVIPA